MITDKTSSQVCYVLGTPLLEIADGTLYWIDRCYPATVCHMLAAGFQLIVVVACIREVASPPSRGVRLDPDSVVVRRLPDYSIGSVRGIFSYINLLRGYWGSEELCLILADSKIIYLDAVISPLAYAVVKMNRTFGKRVLFELRGETLLNPVYLKKRFGFVAPLLMRLHQFYKEQVFSQAVGGVYISQHLHQKYPLRAGEILIADDNYLPAPASHNLRNYPLVARNFIFVGHLEGVKRVGWIIEAFALAHKDVAVNSTLTIIGEGPERADLEKLAFSLGLQNIVRFVGGVPWGELLFQYYQTNDVLLMGSLSEGESRTLREAMHFGLAAVSTDVGSARDMLDLHVITAVGDQMGFAEAIRRLMSEEGMLEKQGKRNAKIAAELFRMRDANQLRKGFWHRQFVAVNAK